MARLLVGSLLMITLITVIAVIIQRWMDNKNYIFSHEEIANIAKKAVGKH